MFFEGGARGEGLGGEGLSSECTEVGLLIVSGRCSVYASVGFFTLFA